MPILSLRTNDLPLAGFQVLGERNSGTNFAKVLLKRNFDLKPVEAYGWKHGFPHAVAYRPDILYVVVFRNAMSWARSMFEKPWHSMEQMQALPFGEFIRAPWHTTIDRCHYFGLDRNSPLMDEPLQLDRHPISGKPFENIFALRNAKTEAFLGMAHRCANVVFVRHEQMAEQSEEMIEHLRSGFDLGHSKPFSAINRRLGSRFAPHIKNRPPRPEEITPADRAFIRDSLDLKQEARLGYSYDA